MYIQNLPPSPAIVLPIPSMSTVITAFAALDLSDITVYTDLSALSSPPHGGLIIEEELTPLLNTLVMGFPFDKDKQKRGFVPLL